MAASNDSNFDMMSMISYAQNLEDVILWRALKHVVHGFYVDVGANDPELDSVTKWFYDQGWHGINIEAAATWYERLLAARSRDLNIHTAVAETRGYLTFYEVLNSGLSTLDPLTAQRYSEAQGYKVVEKSVPVVTLGELLSQHILANSEIHFLKIDVEGFESQVIQGMDFEKFRPWVVVIESTVPQSPELASRSWELTLKKANYENIYFDGLNTFYLAAEHSELRAAFGLPPNVFDDYVTSKVVALDVALKTTQAWGFDLDHKINILNQGMRDREVEIATLNHRIEILDLGLWHMICAEVKDSKLRCRNWFLRQRHMLKEQGIGKRLELLAAKLKKNIIKKKACDLTQSNVAQTAEFHSDETQLHCGVYPAALPEFPARAAASQMPLVNSPDSTLSQPYFRIFGHVSGNYSLSVVNRGVALGLEALYPGCVTFKPFHGGEVDRPQEIPERQRHILHTLFSRSIPDKNAAPYVVSITHHYPLTIDPEPADIRLLIYFWEETRVPDSTISQINNHFDGVLVASRFVKAVLRNSGCVRPIYIIPLGISSANDEPRANPFEKRQGGFRFLHVSSAFPRKGVDVLLRVFFDTYSAADDVELYIKTFPNCHNTIKEQLAALRRETANPPRVRVDEESLSDESMAELYQCADAVVLPTRGEGFNLPAAEAMASGVPLIVTGYGAHTDFATRSTAALIPFRFTLSSSHVHATDSCWVEPDELFLGRLMKSVQMQINAGGRDFKNKLAETRDYVRTRYSWEKCAAAIDAIVRFSRQQRDANRKLRVALISSWGCHCGIAEYTEQLVQRFNERWQLDIYADDRSASFVDDRMRVAWSIDVPDSVTELLSQHPFDRYDVLLFQHQPSLFTITPALAEQMALLEEQGVVVVLELHATKPLVRDFSDFPNAISALSEISRIIVHHVDDLNNLLKLGFADNVALVPHGAFDNLSHFSFDQNQQVRSRLGVEILVSTFGFALPHKGVDLIIRALPELEKRLGKRTGLLAITSALDARSLETLAFWKAVAEEVGVADRITWITDYQPISECIHLLAESDVVVFPYRDTLESASGAVTIGLSSQRPVIVSRTGIFSDLKSCTYAMSGSDVEDIIDAVINIQKNTEIRTTLLKHQLAWLESRSWSMISQRYEAMCQGLVLDKKQAHDEQERSEKLVSRKQLLVDVSTLYQRDGQSGIQRVVRCILKELERQPPVGFVIRPVCSSDGHQYRYCAKFSPENPEMVLWDQQVVSYQAGDFFLGLDLTAHLFPTVTGALSLMRSSGVRICYVLYDILPLKYPHWFPPGLPDMFKRWLIGLSEFADQIMAVSQFSAEQVKIWLHENQLDSSVFVDTFFLGADFERIPSSPDGTVNNTILQKLDRAKTCIAVGTVEVRKGYDQLLDAFEILWAQDPSINLIIVGRPGWHADILIARIRAHPLLGTRLFWFDAAADHLLERCYQLSSVLISASYQEGFGLPLIEAAQRGLKVVARDIPVFREVMNNQAFYFSGEALELAFKVKYAIDQESPGNNRFFECYSWKSSCDSLLCKIGLQKVSCPDGVGQVASHPDEL